MTDSITILIPAAGAARRMRGADKMMEQVGGQPLIARQASAARATGARVLVTLPPGNATRAAALVGLGVETILVPDHAEGLAASLRAGVAALAPGTNALIVFLADLPQITTADLNALISTHRAMPNRIIQAATPDWAPGHPVLLPSWIFPALMELTGDAGARAILARHGESVVLVPLSDARAVTDLDTPEDWLAWRNGHLPR